MKKFNVPCPEVQVLKNHVLIMSFIGENGVPAPKLKVAPLSSADLEDAYEQVIRVGNSWLQFRLTKYLCVFISHVFIVVYKEFADFTLFIALLTVEL